jgi:hypothetical protein|tara:strand:+ start:150 stop:452 length:303 start_codon:yes stop_codon:yes gene_type:complete
MFSNFARLFRNVTEKSMTTTTKEMKVLNALQSGRTLSSAQLKAQFGAGNPQAVIQALRFKGFAIYLNTVTDTKGRSRNVYRLGTPSRAIVAAGYKAMSNS